LAADYEQSRPHSLASGRHRVALELEVDDRAGAIDPEDWDLDQLVHALRSGHARPLRTIQGLVVDAEHDRQSSMLTAIADDLDEAAELQWLASSTMHPAIARVAARRPRPSLEVLVDLQGLAAWARRIAGKLERQGL
jgi:hypothetical protein